MINSEPIIAINVNPKADIFNFADFGIVGDANQIVPALIEGIEKLDSYALIKGYLLLSR